MGEAKRRGSFEERFSDAKIREAKHLAEITEQRRQEELQRLATFEALPEEDQQRIRDRERSERANKMKLRSLLVAAMTAGMR